MTLLHALRERLRDTFTLTMLLAAALVVAGFVAVLLGWRGVAGTLSVPVQLPYLVSSGLTGVCLVAFGSALAAIQSSRRQSAVERDGIDRVYAEAAELLAVLQAKARQDRP